MVGWEVLLFYTSKTNVVLWGGVGWAGVGWAGVGWGGVGCCVILCFNTLLLYVFSPQKNVPNLHSAC